MSSRFSLQQAGEQVRQNDVTFEKSNLSNLYISWKSF